jgi:beta-phosphoglucomutase
MFQAAVFDMDGVIIDSHSIHKEAWRRLLELVGKPVGEEELDFVLDGRKRADIFRHFLGDLSLAQLEAYGKQKDSLFLASADRLSLVPGLPDFVAELRADGVKLAVATSATRKRAEYVLTKFGLRQHFRAVVTGDDVRNGKPDPAIFQKACTQVHSTPGATLVIEDAASGVRGAKVAGMKCLGIAGQARAQLLYEAGADWVQPDFTTVKMSTIAARFGTQPEALLCNPSARSGPEDGSAGGATSRDGAQKV